MKIKAKKTFISGAIYANAGDTIETSKSETSLSD